MKPTSEDSKRRRDKWFEHKGTWAEVTVGTVVADPMSRTRRWEIIATAHGDQVEYGKTLWMRARDQKSGEEKSIAPKTRTGPVVILTQDPADVRTPPRQPPTDTEAILAIVEGLGATMLASHDTATGEVTCPNYDAGGSHIKEGPGRITRGLIEHLRFAHGLDTTALEAMEPTEQIRNTTIAHGRAHDRRYAEGKGGFPHRHVPEDEKTFL